MKIKIGDRFIGNGEPCFIIAEAGVNHNGNVELAKKLVEVARDAGADAVKFQTWITEEVLTKDVEKARYQKELTGNGESQFDMVKKLELSFDDYKGIAEFCKREGIIFLSTPNDKHSVDFLNKLGVPAFKIGSDDLTNIPFLQYVAKKGKPIIISTGMATLDEVREAYESIKNINEKIIFLHCTSNYPAVLETVNLRAIDTLRREFGTPVGYSDHTMGIDVPIVAVALGACIVEKHFTINRNLLGPDHKASIEPNELKEMVRAIKNTEKRLLEGDSPKDILSKFKYVDVMLGTGIKAPADSEKDVIPFVRKCLVAKANIRKGTVLTDNIIAIKRAGVGGLEPKHLSKIIGKKTKMDINKDEMITWDKVG